VKEKTLSANGGLSSAANERQAAESSLWRDRQSELFHNTGDFVRHPQYQSLFSPLSHSTSRTCNCPASLSTSAWLTAYQPFFCASKPSFAKWQTTTPLHRRVRARMVAPDITITPRVMGRVELAITMQKEGAPRPLAIAVHVLSRTRIPL
jgi:hypothetical protein